MRGFLSIAFSIAAWAQTAPFTPPEDISFRRADIVSEGTRMYAAVFALKAFAGKKLPAILIAHGWGGTAALLRPDAIAFARAGYLAVTFDYRGWGDSDSRVILKAPEPREHPMDGSPPKSRKCARSSIPWMKSPTGSMPLPGRRPSHSSIPSAWGSGAAVFRAAWWYTLRNTTRV